MTQETVTGTYIGTESGKTWFGNWLIVNGGETKTVSLSYELPFKLKSLDHMSMIIQKQSGALNEQLNYSLDFTNHQLLWNSSDLSGDKTNLRYNHSLDSDIYLGAVLQK